MALFIAKRRKEFNEGPLLILSYITAAAVQLLAESSVRAARNQVKKGVRRDRAAVRAVNGASLRLWWGANGPWRIDLLQATPDELVERLRWSDY